MLWAGEWFKLVFELHCGIFVDSPVLWKKSNTEMAANTYESSKYDLLLINVHFFLDKFNAPTRGVCLNITLT